MLDLTMCQRCEKWNLIQSMVGVSEDGHLLLVCGSTCVKEGEEVLPSVSVSFPPEETHEEWLVRSLLQLHQPRHVKGVPGQTNDVTYCRECASTWPCKTVQLVGVDE